MSFRDLFGWFGDWPLFFWVAIVGIVFFWLYRRGSDIATGRKPALLFYTLSFFIILEYGKRIGDAIHAPIPVTVVLLALWAWGYYFIYKKGT